MLREELQHAVRNLSRALRFSLACVFTLALALAGTATLLNLLETFFFRQLAVPSPDRLIGISPLEGNASAGFSAQALQALSDRQQALTGICGVTAGYGTLGVQFDSCAARQRPYEAITGTCYEMLGLTASMGRLITTADAPLAGDSSQRAVITGSAITAVAVLASAWPAQRAARTPVATALRSESVLQA